MSCAQGRRATRLRYAPTVTALFILKHFPTLLLIRVVIFGPTVPNTFTESWMCQNPMQTEIREVCGPVSSGEDSG